MQWKECASRKKKTNWNGLKQAAHICKGGYKKPKLSR